MQLTNELIQKIVLFVKQEPRTIQDIARHIEKSWMTAESYVQKIKAQTGLLDLKVFRQGTQGALKIAYWNYQDAAAPDEIKQRLYQQILAGRKKTDFDPFEIYQHITKEKKSASKEYLEESTELGAESLFTLLREAKKEVCCFSGNNSWINLKDKKSTTLEVLEILLQKKISLRILCRIDFGSLQNLILFSKLMLKYPRQIEIRHAVQPLRGFIIDDTRVRLKDEKETQSYKKEELPRNIRILYEWTDPAWIAWTQQVFWNLYRVSIPAEKRVQELEKIF